MRLFEPIRLGQLALRNRVVMAPMTRRMAAEDGIPTDAMVAYYRRRAAGEVGLIVSEGTAIDDRHAWDTLTVPRFETDAQLDGWRRVVEAVHAEDGAFAPQLWHTGRLAYHPIGPSACDMGPRKDGTPRPPVKPMDEGDFEQVLAAYAHAARAARAIGCDALEIHGAHGYLLDSFLSPGPNERTDRYGGSFEHRMRFPLEVVRVVRDAVGPGFPVIYRFSQWRVDAHEELKFKTPDELAVWVTALREAGVDILHVSTARAIDPGFPDLEDPENTEDAQHAEHGEDAERTVGPGDRALSLAGWSQRLSDLPAIAVGSVTVGFTMPETRDAGGVAPVADPAPAIAMVERGEVELLAIGRALIANPDWVKVVRDAGWRELRPYEQTMLGTLV
ncbi:MAG: 12-oxophytodienoate reductase [Candidatus Eiseniibacteriota bacterium]|jgi:2,4-dienoyl-CoA reductase-like NADH-dependent reductase (Old Yellow Enzyme family)